MLPMSAVRLQLGNLLAADATTLAPATNANKIALVVAAFALSENLVAADLTLAAGNGLDPISGSTGSQEVALDPVTQEQLITLKPGATSGFRWVSSGSFTSPITVYGFALLDSTLADLLAAELLPTPIAIVAAGYQIDIDPVTMTFNLQPIS